MLLTKDMIKEYGLDNVEKIIGDLIKNKKEFAIEFSDGEAYFTPHNICSWFDYETDENHDLLHHGYYDAFRYVCESVIDCDGKLIDIYTVNDYGDIETIFED